ncbi:uncharacterized protein LOC105433778 [Pogonomyrmex barbatus]|uniref:Uncharacterized protein LOC105433778 n=1 Tax=Pogonomyrmex barbatus TaxID=144034 RepID=A0A8N1SAA9_9HYME|nr:uncharacterized protein LOC105433778 [Pogonomyrmex barbatus]
MKLNKRRNSFRFYEQMKFLDDDLRKSATYTSLPTNIINNNNDNEIEAIESESTCSNILNSSPMKSTNSESNKIDKSNKMNEEFNEAVIATLRDNKQPDEIDGFVLLLGEGLRKLPYRERTKLQLN